MKKNKLLKLFVVAGMVIAATLTVSLTSVNAASVYDDYAINETSDTQITSDQEYSVEEMLQYALWDEYMAQAEYNAIIDTFGDVKPFTMIVQAEQTHIDLLLPLFETYGIDVPENSASDNVVIPESITSALATGVEAETANIEMYQTFLAQTNLPDDVRTAFEFLVSASQNHLEAFSKDRYSYYGEDLMQQVRNMFQNRNQQQGQGNGSGNQYKGSNGSQGSQGSQGNNYNYDGDCPNS